MKLINTKDIKEVFIFKEAELEEYKYTFKSRRKYIFFGPKIYRECWENVYNTYTLEDIKKTEHLKVVGNALYLKACIKVDNKYYYFNNNTSAEKAYKKIKDANPYLVEIY